MGRDRVRKDDVEALDQALRGMFQRLQARALPDSLRPDSPSSLLEQLFCTPPKRRLGEAG